VKLDWDKHIPVMNAFWGTTLLGKMKYKGNPMLKHIELNEKEPLGAEHFERWLFLWENTIRKNFNGTKAEEAIKRARQIAELMKFKIQQHSNK
jgi:hemoglobin